MNLALQKKRYRQVVYKELYHNIVMKYINCFLNIETLLFPLNFICLFSNLLHENVNFVNTLDNI